MDSEPVRMWASRPAKESSSPASKLAGVGLVSPSPVSCESSSPASKLAGVRCVGASPIGKYSPLRNRRTSKLAGVGRKLRRSFGLPSDAVREAIVNALIHRDYDIRGAKCQLIVTADTITVKSPGGPVSPITLEQLQSFNAPMLSRNPELHYVFSRMELAEERGLGLRSLRSEAQTAGLPFPR